MLDLCASAPQKALIRLYPDILRNTEPSDISILWPALLHIQALSGCSGLPLHVGIVSQRIKDQIPSIEDDVDDHVFVLGPLCTRERKLRKQLLG